jgi:subtilisin family serine protease
MSIGTSEPADCTDPMAAAVDRISANSGALFVIAAGNLGGPQETITSPGCPLLH